MWPVATNSQAELGVPVGLLVGLGFIVLLFAIIFVGIRSSRKAKKKRQQLLSEKGISETSNAHHLEGLPIAEKTLCELNLFEDQLVIVGGGVNFNLPIQQITAVEIKTDVEIANIVSSSAAKGIAGGLLLGPIGLVVGSRANSKEKRTLHYYLVINYVNSSGEVAAMLFSDDVTTHLTNRLVAKLKPKISENQVKSVQL